MIGTTQSTGHHRLKGRKIVIEPVVVLDLEADDGIEVKTESVLVLAVALLLGDETVDETELEAGLEAVIVIVIVTEETLEGIGLVHGVGAETGRGIVNEIVSEGEIQEGIEETEGCVCGLCGCS